MPAKRYQFQDGEVVREADVVRRISEAWREQIEEHNLRMRLEQEEKEKNNLELEIARKNWERSEEEVLKHILHLNVFAITSDFLLPLRATLENHVSHYMKRQLMFCHPITRGNANHAASLL